MARRCTSRSTSTARLDPGPRIIEGDLGMAWGVGGWLVSYFLAKLSADEVASLRARVARELKTIFASRYTAKSASPKPSPRTSSAPTPNTRRARNISSYERAQSVVIDLSLADWRGSKTIRRQGLVDQQALATINCRKSENELSLSHEQSWSSACSRLQAPRRGGVSRRR